jgi:hypothetical protein
MKKLLLTLLTFTGTAFASNLQVNPQHGTAPKKKQSIGHWVISIASEFHNEDATSPILQVLVGYQSAAERSKFFQSQKIEFGGGSSLDSEHRSSYFPKFTGIHYFDFDSSSRYFFSVGGALGRACHLYTETRTRSVYVDESGVEGKTESYDYKEGKQKIQLMACAGIGIEMGEFSGVINSLELSIDQPTFFFKNNQRTIGDYLPTAKISYSAGF